MRRKALFSILPLLLLLATGELGARCWLYLFAPPDSYTHYAVPEEFPTAAKYTPHHYLCYALQPGYQRGGTSHNSHGFRGPEISTPKPAGVFRIVITGGSTTYGEFIEDDADTFPAKLQTILRTLTGNDAIEVVNGGVPGYCSWESLGNLAFRLLEFEPDLVIPYEGVNDVHARLVRPNAYRSDNAGRRTIWTEPVEVRICKHSVLARILGHHLGLWRLPGVDSYVQAPTSDPGTHTASKAIGGDPMEVLKQNSTDYTRRNIKNMVAMSRVHGAGVLLATWAHSAHKGDYAATPHYELGFREYNDAVRDLARELDCPLFDFAEEMPDAPELWRDGRHVNAAGADLQSRMFARFLIDHTLVPDSPTQDAIDPAYKQLSQRP